MTDHPKHAEVADATAEVEATMAPQVVPVNMYETSEALVLVAPMPAVMPGDVTIEVRPGRVRIWAHLRSAAPKDYLLHEWDYGGYERELEIPAGFGRSAEASLANGQLALRILRGDPEDDIKLAIHPG